MLESLEQDGDTIEARDLYNKIQELWNFDDILDLGLTSSFHVLLEILLCTCYYLLVMKITFLLKHTAGTLSVLICLFYYSKESLPYQFYKIDDMFC